MALVEDLRNIFIARERERVQELDRSDQRRVGAATKGLLGHLNRKLRTPAEVNLAVDADALRTGVVVEVLEPDQDPVFLYATFPPYAADTEPPPATLWAVGPCPDCGGRTPLDPPAEPDDDPDYVLGLAFTVAKPAEHHWCGGRA